MYATNDTIKLIFPNSHHSTLQALCSTPLKIAASIERCVSLSSGAGLVSAASFI